LAEFCGISIGESKDDIDVLALDIAELPHRISEGSGIRRICGRVNRDCTANCWQFPTFICEYPQAAERQAHSRQTMND